MEKQHLNTQLSLPITDSEPLDINVEKFLTLRNWESLLLNLMETYVDEILHALRVGNEQTTHATQIPFVEDFLGIRLPRAAKNLKASNYYTKKS